MVVINILNKMDVKPLTTASKICMCLLSPVFYGMEKLRVKNTKLKIAAAIVVVQLIYFHSQSFRKIVHLNDSTNDNNRSLV